MEDRNRTLAGIEDVTDIVGEHGERVTGELAGWHTVTPRRNRARRTTAVTPDPTVEGGEEANHYDGSDDAATNGGDGFGGNGDTGEISVPSPEHQQRAALYLGAYLRVVAVVQAEDARPHNLMDLPAALLARPLGYLDAQSVMIVSTLNTQYRAVVCGSEMEGGLLRSQIYLSAMKAELRNAKKELTEAEDAIVEKNRRIIELEAVFHHVVRIGNAVLFE